jgi:hypothetical protein
VPNSQKTRDQILEGRRTISFRDFEALLGAPGFTLVVNVAAIEFISIERLTGRFPFSPLATMQSTTRCGSFAI